MASPRAIRLGSLTRDTSLEIRASARCGGEEGLFTTTAAEEGDVLLSDIALCWLPSSTTEGEGACNCRQCGAFVEGPARLLQTLSGDAEPLDLPAFDAAEASSEQGHQCSHGAHPVRLHIDAAQLTARDGWEQVQLAAQVAPRPGPCPRPHPHPHPKPSPSPGLTTDPNTFR